MERRKHRMPGMALAATSNLALALAGRSEMLENRIFGHDNITRMIQRQKRTYRTSGPPAGINRRTGRPHENRREMARHTTPVGSARRAAAYAAARVPS